MQNSDSNCENPSDIDGVRTASEPVELDYAVRGSHRDFSTTQDHVVVRIFFFVLIFGLLLPVVLGTALIIAALLIF